MFVWSYLIHGQLSNSPVPSTVNSTTHDTSMGWSSPPIHKASDTSGPAPWCFPASWPGTGADTIPPREHESALLSTKNVSSKLKGVQKTPGKSLRAKSRPKNRSDGVHRIDLFEESTLTYPDIAISNVLDPWPKRRNRRNGTFRHF